MDENIFKDDKKFREYVKSIVMECLQEMAIDNSRSKIAAFEEAKNNFLKQS